MARYIVLEPVIFVNKGKVVSYRKPSPPEGVLIPDDVAVTLGDKVKRLGAPPEDAPVEPPAKPEPKTDPPKPPKA